MPVAAAITDGWDMTKNLYKLPVVLLAYFHSSTYGVISENLFLKCWTNAKFTTSPTAIRSATVMEVILVVMLTQNPNISTNELPSCQYRTTTFSHSSIPIFALNSG